MATAFGSFFMLIWMIFSSALIVNPGARNFFYERGLAAIVQLIKLLDFLDVHNFQQ